MIGEVESETMTGNTQAKSPSFIWTAEDLAAFVGYSIYWVYKQTQKGSTDPPPRCPGIKELRFNTRDPRFREWLERRLGPIDLDSLNG
jgi:hypothetical protein